MTAPPDTPSDPEQDARRTRRAEFVAAQETRVVLKKADEAYAPYSCPASGECCQLATTKREPWLWPTEWLVLEEHLRRTNRSLPTRRADGGCPFLDAEGKRCTVYEDRPFGCRTFFCSRIQGPSKQPVDAVIQLSKRLEQIAQRLQPDCAGPRPIGEWFERAWEK